MVGATDTGASHANLDTGYGEDVGVRGNLKINGHECFRIQGGGCE
jgi:hypothetical protein